MNVAIGNDAHHTSRKNDIPLEHVTGGLLEADDEKERTFPILDALASICVSEPEKQVVAIGLQLNLSDGKVCLTVAENGNVKKGLLAYLRQAWELMRQLSMEFKEDRVQRYSPREHMQYRKVSPRMPEGVGQDIRISLFRHIYLYTKRKNDLRVSKWLGPLEKFMQRFYKYQNAQTEGLEGYNQNLDAAFRALRGAYKDLGSKPRSAQTSHHWKALYALLEVATFYIQRLTQTNRWICDSIVLRVGKY